MKPALAADPVVAERFRREAIAVAQLSHPNIVAVYDAIEDTAGSSRRLAVVMQLVNGKSLRQLLDEQRRLSPDLTIHIGSCVAAALDAAHRAGLVHRDVKPGNILITPDGRVLLTDFGIAKGLGATGDDLTSANVMMGTAKYLSPEQVRGKKLDGRADLYSLGLVLYECLAGRVPFLGETDTDTALARLNRDPTDLARLRPTLPYGLAELIHRLLARRPMDRFATGAEVRAELTRIADRHPIRRRDRPGRHAARRRGDRRSTTMTAVTESQPVTIGGYRPCSAAAGRSARRNAATAHHRAPPDPGSNRTEPSSSAADRRLMLVGGLLAAALVWAGCCGRRCMTTPRRRAGSAAVGPADHRPRSAAPAQSKIVEVTTYDPDGDDGQENDDLVATGHRRGSGHRCGRRCATARGRSAASRASASSPTSVSPPPGRSRCSIASAPYQVQILTAGEGRSRRQIADWGSPLKRAAGADPGADHRVDQQADPLRAGAVQAAGQDPGVHQQPLPRRRLRDELRRQLTALTVAGRTAGGGSLAAIATQLADHELVTAAQGGDRGALDQLLRRHYDRVHAVCRRITGHDADAADAAQDAMIAMVRNLDRFDGRSSFGTWAYRIATNASLDELRRRKRRPVPASSDDDRPHDEPADPDGGERIDAVGDHLALDAALRQLSDEYRLPVVLRDVADLDYAEIAAVLDIPAGTVRSRIARGRAALAKPLSPPSGNQPRPIRERPSRAP